jgi:hypothetical protein
VGGKIMNKTMGRWVLGFAVAASWTAAGCSAGDGAQLSEHDVSEHDATGVEGTSATTVSKAELTRRRAAIRDYFEAQRATLKIRATSTLESGHVVDWVDAKSQVPDGKLAEPPPAMDAELKDPVRSDLELDPSAHGPEGTMPIYRPDSDFVLDNVELPATVEEFLRQPRPDREPMVPDGELGQYGHQGWADYAHRYANAQQGIATDNLYGTDGYIYVADPYVYRTDEFSLGQTLVSRGTGAGTQTVEVGWQDFRNYYGDFNPHLFVFFNTNNYAPYGNNVGGYNRDYTGWVQSSPILAPRAALTVGSELYIRVLMYGGNWWVNVNNEWIGYYPGTLFATTGLRNWANSVSWFGELLDYLPDNTTTYSYMGNGNFAGPGARLQQQRHCLEDLLVLRWLRKLCGWLSVKLTPKPCRQSSSSTAGVYGACGGSFSACCWRSGAVMGGPYARVRSRGLGVLDCSLLPELHTADPSGLRAAGADGRRRRTRSGAGVPFGPGRRLRAPGDDARLAALLGPAAGRLRGRR